MPMHPQLAVLATAQGGPFTTAQARAVGYGDREIYRKLVTRQWSRLRREIYVEAALLCDNAAIRHIMDLRAALLCLKGPIAASHVTSATLHQIALLDPDFSLVHITREKAGSSRTESGVRHHDAALPPGQLTTVGGLLVTSAARTVVDLARTLSFEAGLVAAESALNRGLVSPAELREIMSCCLDWPGARAAGRVVSFASCHSESPGESLSRIAFEAVRLPPPRQQVEIYDSRGFIARADFYWEEQRTVGEFDGRLKYAGDSAALYDEKRREDRLRDAGVEVFRFGWMEVQGRPQSIRHKALAAFDRAARYGAHPNLRFKFRPDADE
jgi:hypothetical protein